MYQHQHQQYLELDCLPLCVLPEENLFENSHQQLVHVVLQASRGFYELGVVAVSQLLPLLRRDLAGSLQVHFVPHQNTSPTAPSGLRVEVLQDLLRLSEALAVNDGVHNHASLRLVRRYDILHLSSDYQRTPTLNTTYRHLIAGMIYEHQLGLNSHLFLM